MSERPTITSLLRTLLKQIQVGGTPALAASETLQDMNTAKSGRYLFFPKSLKIKRKEDTNFVQTAELVDAGQEQGLEWDLAANHGTRKGELEI